MVDIRSARSHAGHHVYQGEDTSTLHTVPDTSITPPSLDLMERLRQMFPITIPHRAHSARVLEEVAEMRGAYLVIDYLQSLVDAHAQASKEATA